MTKAAQQIKKVNSRELAFSLLYRVANDGAYANLLLDKELSSNDLTRQDAALITQLVYGVLRRQAALDHMIGQFLTRPLNKLPLKILLILRLGVYQLYYMDKIPASAAVNESVKLAKKHGHEGTVRLVNGVLRKIAASLETISWPDPAENMVKYIAVTESHPVFLVERWLAELGPEETMALCQKNNETSPLTLRVNTLQITKGEVLAELAALGIEAKEGLWAPDAVILQGGNAPGSLAIFRQGKVLVQDESSQLAALNLAPPPGGKVLDLCAAPGGKTTYLAQLMEDSGEIRAFDVYPHKIALIEENCRRLGVHIVHAALGDAAVLNRELLDWADAVLVDAPCSGLGVLGRRPDARWQKSPALICEMALLSGKILDNAAAYVKKGGRLLYSTCTLTHEENQDNVAAFLKNHPAFHLVPLPALPKAWQAEGAAMWQIWPQRSGTDGFFLALLERKE